MSDKVLDTAYETLTQYVKRVGFSKQFTTNTLRTKLSEVRGLSPSQYGGVINKALRNRLIFRIGTTRSNEPNHNGGAVGVYERY